MNDYIVYIRKTEICKVKVKAVDKEQAIILAMGEYRYGNYDELGVLPEYSFTMFKDDYPTVVLD